MVISMLVSMVLTRVAQDGLVFFTCFKMSGNQKVGDNKENVVAGECCPRNSVRISILIFWFVE